MSSWVLLTVGDKMGWNDNATSVNLGLMIGMNRQQKMQSSIMAITAFLLMLGGTLTSSFISAFDTALAPHDFYQKGTLSNLAQDINTPHGRLWATALIVCSMLLLFSMYPFWLYRCWSPCHSYEENPIVHGVFEPKWERMLRSLWLVVPNVGFILTGAIPSLSGVHGYKLALTGVHNICAPLSMLFCMIMETFQLGYGENAFAYVFSKSSATRLYGPLNLGQRVRVVTLCGAWFSGMIFVSVQGYLFLFKNTSYWVAVASYFTEVTGMVLANAMPAIAGIFYLIDMEKGTVMQETDRLIQEHLTNESSQKGSVEKKVD